MPDSDDMLMVEFLSWVSSRDRTYDEAMEAWQSHCPRQTIWEDAIIKGYIQLNGRDKDPEIVLTSSGRDFLNGNNARR